MVERGEPELENRGGSDENPTPSQNVSHDPEGLEETFGNEEDLQY